MLLLWPWLFIDSLYLSDLFLLLLLRRVISKERGKKRSCIVYSRPFFFFSSGSIARIVHRRVGKLGQVSMADDGLLLIPFQNRWRRANKTPSRASLN